MESGVCTLWWEHTGNNADRRGVNSGPAALFSPLGAFKRLIQLETFALGPSQPTCEGKVQL